MGSKFILLIIIVSGLIAYVGDYVGRFFGRRRLSVFGLRPRYTAILITVLSGILIASLTAGLLLLASKEVRTALFGISTLRQNLAAKTAEKNKLETELSRIQGKLKAAGLEVQKISVLKSRLNQEVNQARSGLVIFKIGDVIASTLIEAGLDKKIVKDSLEDFLELGGRAVLQVHPDFKIILPSDEMTQAVKFLSKKEGEFIVRLVAAQNVMYGEQIPLHFEMFKNLLVFKEGEVILSGVIDGRKPLPEIEKDLRGLLERVNTKARQKGILPDQFGSIGTVSYATIYKTAQEIKAGDKLVDLDVISFFDAYTLGTLKISLRIN